MMIYDDARSAHCMIDKEIMMHDEANCMINEEMMMHADLTLCLTLEELENHQIPGTLAT
jgi:hypothetical protein